MAVTSARAAFIQQPYRRAIAESTAAKSRHGMLARETEDPAPTRIDNLLDAQAEADERLALLSPERRLFSVRVVGLDEVLALDPTDGLIPNVRYIDTVRDCDRTCLVATVEIDISVQQATLGVWG